MSAARINTGACAVLLLSYSAAKDVGGISSLLADCWLFLFLACNTIRGVCDAEGLPSVCKEAAPPQLAAPDIFFPACKKLLWRVLIVILLDAGHTTGSCADGRSVTAAPVAILHVFCIQQQEQLQGPACNPGQDIDVLLSLRRRPDLFVVPRPAIVETCFPSWTGQSASPLNCIALP